MSNPLDYLAPEFHLAALVAVRLKKSNAGHPPSVQRGSTLKEIPHYSVIITFVPSSPGLSTLKTVALVVFFQVGDSLGAKMVLSFWLELAGSLEAVRRRPFCWLPLLIDEDVVFVSLPAGVFQIINVEELAFSAATITLFFRIEHARVCALSWITCEKNFSTAPPTNPPTLTLLSSVLLLSFIVSSQTALVGMLIILALSNRGTAPTEKTVNGMKTPTK